jgi:hypothetical protein
MNDLPMTRNGLAKQQNANAVIPNVTGIMIIFVILKSFVLTA